MRSPRWLLKFVLAIMILIGVIKLAMHKLDEGLKTHTRCVYAEAMKFNHMTHVQQCEAVLKSAPCRVYVYEARAYLVKQCGDPNA